MNYIAHIQLGYHSKTSMLGNFLGDFVKGQDLSHLPAQLQLGIKVHRKVDVFTDQHNKVRQLKSLFPVATQRFANIALDIYFDHLLCSHWQNYCKVPQPELFAQFYQELDVCNIELGERFQRVKIAMLQHRWLADYQYPQTCLQAMQSIEQRLGRKYQFAQNCYANMRENHLQIEKHFLSFYSELIQHTQLISTKL